MKTDINNIFNYSNSEVFSGLSQTVEICKGQYKGIIITEIYRSPRHWGKQATLTYLIDLIFPMGLYDCLSDQFYTAEGYGMPIYGTLEQAIEFINEYKEK